MVSRSLITTLLLKAHISKGSELEMLWSTMDFSQAFVPHGPKKGCLSELKGWHSSAVFRQKKKKQTRGEHTYKTHRHKIVSLPCLQSEWDKEEEGSASLCTTACHRAHTWSSAAFPLRNGGFRWLTARWNNAQCTCRNGSRLRLRLIRTDKCTNLCRAISWISHKSSRC